MQCSPRASSASNDIIQFPFQSHLQAPAKVHKSAHVRRGGSKQQYVAINMQVKVHEGAFSLAQSSPLDHGFDMDASRLNDGLLLPIDASLGP